MAEAVAECCKMCGHSPDADENVTDRMIRDARRLFAKAESAGDIRGAVVAHRELRDALRFIQELLGPASEDTPAVLVTFTFPPSGLHGEAWTTSDPNEYMPANVEVSGQRVAAAGRTTPDLDSGMPEIVEDATPNVAPVERPPEESVVAPSRARDASIWKAAGTSRRKDGDDD